MRLGGAEGGELIKVKSGDFSGKSFRYCNVTTQPGELRIGLLHEETVGDFLEF